MINEELKKRFHQAETDLSNIDLSEHFNNASEDEKKKAVEIMSEFNRIMKNGGKNRIEMAEKYLTHIKNEFSNTNR